MIFILVGAECSAFLRRKFFSFHLFCSSVLEKSEENSFNLFWVLGKFENCIELCRACGCFLIENVDQIMDELDCLRLKLRLN